MVINWYGEGCFKIQTSATAILVDPFPAKSPDGHLGGSARMRQALGGESIGTGLTPPRFKADIVLRTVVELKSYGPRPTVAQSKNSSTHQLINSSTDIIGPGEYEIKGIEINGLMLAPDKTIYIVNAEDMRLAFLGHIADETPDADLIEKLNGADLLFIPAGGRPFIEQEKAAKLIKQISPKMVVASFFKTPGLKRKTENAQEFLKELEKKTEAQEKLTIKKKDLTEKMEVAVLKI